MRLGMQASSSVLVLGHVRGDTDWSWALPQVHMAFQPESQFKCRLRANQNTYTVQQTLASQKATLHLPWFVSVKEGSWATCWQRVGPLFRGMEVEANRYQVRALRSGFGKERRGMLGILEGEWQMLLPCPVFSGERFHLCASLDVSWHPLLLSECPPPFDDSHGPSSSQSPPWCMPHGLLLIIIFESVWQLLFVFDETKWPLKTGYEQWWPSILK